MTDHRGHGGLREKYLSQTAACPTADLPCSTSWAAAVRQPHLPARDQAPGAAAQTRGSSQPALQPPPAATGRSSLAAAQRSPTAVPSRPANQHTLAACGRRSPVSDRAGRCRSLAPAAVLMPTASPKARTPGTPDSGTGAVSIPSSPAAEAVSVRSSPSAEHAADGRKRAVRHLRLDMGVDERRLSCGSRYPRGSLDLPSDGSGANEVGTSLAARRWPTVNAVVLLLSEWQACHKAVICLPSLNVKAKQTDTHRHCVLSGREPRGLRHRRQRSGLLGRFRWGCSRRRCWSGSAAPAGTRRRACCGPTAACSLTAPSSASRRSRCAGAGRHTS